MTLQFLKSTYQKHKEKRLSHRYICNDHIGPILSDISSDFVVQEIGKSVNNEPIFSVKFGSGSKKVLMWSQMHGNESTTTKAIFDLFSSLTEDKKAFSKILEQCTVVIVPILNPDGARAYTRINANAIDLNRDAKDLSQPESKVLRQLFDSFKPDFCFNLHGQRTIFSAGSTNNPATISFLAPSEDEERSLTTSRSIAMRLIALLNQNLQLQIPDQVGRYDDTYNANCVGDTFQALGVSTVLFEAGHYPGDYGREVTREFIFQSLVLALHHIAQDTINQETHESYFSIPENEKLFYDIIIKNGLVDGKKHDVAIQYQEVLSHNAIKFSPKIEKIGDLESYFAHKYHDTNNGSISTHNSEAIFEGYENDFVLINTEKLSLIF